MWLSNRLKLIGAHLGPVVLAGAASFGTQHIISALKDAAATPVWLEFGTSEQEDPVAQGNLLAEGIKKTLGNALFEYSLPYSYGLKVLDLHLELLGPFTFLLSNAEYGAEFATALTALNRSGSRVVLAFSRLPDDLDLPATALVLRAAELRLSRAEAFELAGDLLPGEVDELLHKSDGAFEAFTTRLHGRLHLPTPLRPGPDGPRLPEGQAVEVDPETLLKVLSARDKWTEALELAVTALPERVPDILKQAGHLYHERGLHKRLWELLQDLPEHLQDETVLFWQLSAGGWLGKAEHIRESVERFLAVREAPDLRALYAGVLAPIETAENEAERAYRAQASPLSVYQYGRRLSDREERVQVLQRAVRLAEHKGRAYEVTRNAGELMNQLIDIGRYNEAVYWGDWTLTQFDRHGLGNAQRRLLLVNNWAFARILIGETAGLLERLREGETQLAEAFPALAQLYRETLGDYLLATGEAEKALVYYRKNWAAASRVMSGENVLGVTQALLHLGEHDAALNLATQAKVLTAGESANFSYTAHLAYGMALAMSDPESGRRQLALTPKDESYTPPVHLVTQKALYLAWAYLQTGDTDAARLALKEGEQGLSELSQTGLTLLSGPERDFREVWTLLNGHEFPLELRFLGSRDAWFNDKLLKLAPQACDILALLALNKQGLSLEQILLLLYGDEGSRGAVKVALSQLRKHVPVSHQPYRLETGYQADFLSLHDLLVEGRVRRAVDLYRGPLLPDSEAPGIVEAREAAEEALRQATLLSNDAEALLALAEKMPADLELWEAAEAALHTSDPRFPIIKARAEQVRKSWLNS